MCCKEAKFPNSNYKVLNRFLYNDLSDVYVRNDKNGENSNMLMHKCTSSKTVLLENDANV